MATECPQCGHKELSEDNPYGFSICPECHWMEAKTEESLSPQELLQKTLKWSGFLALVIFLLGFSIQLLLWNRFALDVSFLHFKKIFGVETLKDQLELGAICNSLDKNDCSVKVFKNVVEEHPQNKTALANLAINYSKLNKWSYSLPHFEAYFSLGGQGFDVMYWYALSLFNTGKDSDGIKWLYFSLSANQEYQPATQKLFRKLIAMNRPYEALSIIASLTSGELYAESHWKKEITELNEKLPSAEKGSDILNIPSVDGVYFYMPVWLKQKAPIRFFAVDSKVQEIIINEDILFENQIKIPAGKKTKEVFTLDGKKELREVNLSELYIGPWVFEDINAFVCHGCRSVLGQKFLKKFKSEYWRQQNIRYLSLLPKSSL